MKNRPNQYVLDRKSFCGKAAILCLFLAMVFRCVGGLLNLTIFEDRFATVEFLLPVGCCILYILCILIFGRRWFKISVVPFLLGVMACVLRLYSYDNLLQQEASFERILCSIFFYLIVASAYSGIVLGSLRGKTLLLLLFLVPLGSHAWFEIYPLFRDGIRVEPSLILMELSVLCVIVAMLFAAAGMHLGVPGSRSTGSKPAPAPSAPETEETDAAPADAPAEPSVPERVEPPVTADEASAEEPTSSLSSPATEENEEEEAEEEDGYDPFAPSPIHLTLNPDLDEDHPEGEAGQDGADA